MFQIFKISGDSLYPYYKDGERVVCRSVSQKTDLKVDDTVVFNKDKYGLMIKKINAIEGLSYFVQGTNPYSIDSRDFGLIKHTEIKYKVLFKF
jgi:phage repressor protein C with HTH and peptisase S24 domain